MDPELVKWFASLGVGGTIAALIFWFYRKDFIQERNHNRAGREKGQQREEHLLSVITGNAVATNELAGEIRNLSTFLKDESEKRMQWEEKRQIELVSIIKERRKR